MPVSYSLMKLDFQVSRERFAIMPVLTVVIFTHTPTWISSEV